MTKTKIYDITYTTAKNDEKHIFVKAKDVKEALQHANYNCFTGRDFRNPVVITGNYSTPRNNGYQGSERG